MNETTISWTDFSWNVVFGCSHVSPGCEHCYAEALALRFGHSRKPWTARNAQDNVVLKPHKLGEARSPKLAGRRVFVNSTSDLFHERVPFDFIDRVFDAMEARPDVTFQILTKRPERMRKYTTDRWIKKDDERDYDHRELPNVWLGVSVEDRRRAKERIPILLGTPAAVKFLSCEPLLSGLYLMPYLDPETARCDRCYYEPWDDDCGCSCHRETGLDWVIVGGETGPKHRPMDLRWARFIQRQCAAAHVPFFFKQESGRLPGRGADALGRLYHEFPGEPREVGQAS